MFIFLDIDGVLNKESDWSKPFSLNSDCIRRFCEKIEKLVLFRFPLGRMALSHLTMRKIRHK